MNLNPTQSPASIAHREKIDVEIARIISAIEPPRIPERELDLITFSGLVPDAAGTHDFCDAIARAIAHLDAQGGGRLVFRHPRAKEWARPTVTFRVRGPIHLKNRIALEFDHGVRLFFEFDPLSYLPGGRGVFRYYEGTGLYSFSPLIYACGAEDIAIRARAGHGADPVIDGDGERWQTWSETGQDAARAAGKLPASKRLKNEINRDRVPLAERRFIDPEHDHFRPDLIGLHLCRRVLVEGLTLRASPFWVVHPVFCEQVTVRALTFDCYVVNNDGVDVDSCRKVLVERILFGNHDDNVVIKNGMDLEGREGLKVAGTEIAAIKSSYVNDGLLHGPTEEVVVRHCVFKGHYGFCLGSDISNLTRRIYAVDCQAVQKILSGVYIKCSRSRGGQIRDIHVDNFDLGEIQSEALCINLNYDNDNSSPYPPMVENVTVQRIRASQARRAIVIEGWADRPVRDITLRDIVVDRAEKALVVQQAEDVRCEGVFVAGICLDGVHRHNDSTLLPPCKI
jgi:polygalacturonase